jgi:hypothetical protein
MPALNKSFDLNSKRLGQIVKEALAFEGVRKGCLAAIQRSVDDMYLV